MDDRIALGHEPVEKASGPQVLAEHQEVIDALHHLEEKDREVMVLRYIEGLEPKDIGTFLNESANVISVRINRATKRLQTILHI